MSDILPPAPDILSDPEHHLHDWIRMIECSTTHNGIDQTRLDAHHLITPYGWNGGKRCDVNLGDCSCGATHTTSFTRVPPPRM